MMLRLSIRGPNDGVSSKIHQKTLKKQFLLNFLQ